MIVLDASVAIKWYQPEALSDEADALLLKHAGQILGPHLLAIEVCAALVRHANVYKPAAPPVLVALDRFATLLEAGDVVLESTSPASLRKAASLALELGHPLKDCVYLMLAIERGIPMVTADTRFVAKIAALYPRIILLSAFSA